jgi:hypothetical protein
VRISALWIAIGGASLLIGQEAVKSEVAAPAAAQPAAEEPEGRILGFIPNNKTVPQSKPAVEQLTVRQKFNIAFKDTTDPYTVVLAGFYAGVAQWQNDFPSYGQGAAGYGKRIGAAYADQAIGNYLTEGIVPSLFHEDPRYFRKGTGPGRRRIVYALTRTLITRTDKGKNRFNYSEFVGNSLAAGISNLYYPASERTVGETVEKIGLQVVSDSAINVLFEFWPDMKHKFLKR